MTILFDIFEMFRISKCNRAFTKYMIEIANYAIMPLKGFLLGIFFISLVVNCSGIVR